MLDNESEPHKNKNKKSYYGEIKAYMMHYSSVSSPENLETNNLSARRRRVEDTDKQHVFYVMMQEYNM